MSRVIDFFGACWVLMTLGVVSRFRFSGRYWNWRTATAFPEGTHPDGLLGMCGAAYEYARWAWHLRRLR